MPRNISAAAIYSRKSKFTGRGESIGNQAELCREYIRVNYPEAACGIAIYEDEGFSGGDLNRPAFSRMMEDAGKGAFQVIVVYRLDRISRNISDFSGLIDKLARMDIAFVSVREQFDTGTPMGRAMMYIASVFSQLERETIAERIRDNMLELAKTGRWLGGTTPTGYASEDVTSMGVDGRQRKVCRLKLIPGEATKVKEIFSLYLETDSLTLTEAELIKKGEKTKNKKNYTRFAIKGILQNPVYMIADRAAYDYFVKKEADLCSPPEDFDGICGMLAYNRTDQEKGRTTRERPVREWIVTVGGHPGIIPGRTWVRVQESLERNKSKAFYKSRGNEALLTGVLYCSCGGRMYPKLGRAGATKNKRHYTYVCKEKERSKGAICAGANVNGNRMDHAVLEQIKNLQEDRQVFVACLKKECSFYLAAREQRWSDFGRCLEEGTVEQKRGAVRALIRKVIWTGETAHIILVGAEDEAPPGEDSK